MKNDKIKSKSTESSEFSIAVELQAGRRANFTYNELALAEAHYTILQAYPSIGNLGIKTIKRSWKQ